MSAWHREHPELTGTEADPWMIHDGYRKASAMGERPRGMPSYAELEEMSEARCTDEDCRRVQKRGPACVECGAPLGDNDY